MNNPGKRILMTGGGTAGHVTPNIALIPGLKALEFDIHYVGRRSGIERSLIEQVGISYHAISAGKLRRYFDIENFIDFFRIAWGCIQSFVLIRKLYPQVIFSKGGFVACPVVWAARIHRIPVIIHESDMSPGLANRLSMPFADRICFSFPETETKLPKEKAIYTGIPIRKTLLSGDKAEGKRLCGFTNERPVVLIIGGSQGALAINRTIRAALNKLLEDFNICHICGQGGIETDLEAKSGYKQFEYVNKELPHLFAMADVVISRAGATTLFELLELRKANLLIPLSLKASRGDQILNARSFEKQGFSYVLTEEDMTVTFLIEGIIKTYANRNAFIEAMNSAGSVNGVNRVLNVIESYTHAA
jgi:UDP-N-acetylglucosamine--N-acetylmuramyl-(pentapeptide) pyrophosphoryl-undecaprenol N-acetylglucosamine transferase